MRNKNGNSHLRTSFVILSIVFLLNGCNILLPESYYYTPITTHHVIHSLGFKEIWVHENIFIGSDNLGPMMVAGQGIVAFLGGVDKNDRSTITTLETDKANLQWQRGSGIPTAIFVSSSALYIGNSGGASVVKYQLNTGEVSWKTSLPDTRGLAYLIVIEGDVYVQTSATHDKFFVLNADTGGIVRQREGTAIFVSTDKVTFQRSIISNELIAVDTSTQKLLWSAKVSHQFLMAPVFTEHEILIRTDVGEVYCLDRETGSLKWNTENIAISNLAVARNLVYFLTRDGKLQGVDLQSGEIKYFVQFDTDRFVLNGEVHIGGYHVAFDPQTKIVLAELGDSAQLFAFQTLEG